MNLKTVATASAVFALSFGSVASGTTFTLKACVSNAWTAEFDTQFLAGGNPFPPPFVPSQSFVRSKIHSDAVLHEVDFYVSVSDLDPNALGLGSITWNVNLSSGLAPSVYFPAWERDTTYTDINGSEPGGAMPLFLVNADLGTVGDLQNITQSIAEIPSPGATDLRAQIGQADTWPQPFNSGIPNVNQFGWPDGNTYLGSLYITWFGDAPQRLEAVLTSASNALLSDGSIVEDTGAVLQHATVMFVPEPPGWSLLALGLLAMLCVSRRPTLTFRAFR